MTQHLHELSEIAESDEDARSQYESEAFLDADLSRARALSDLWNDSYIKADLLNGTKDSAAQNKTKIKKPSKPRKRQKPAPEKLEKLAEDIDF